MQYFVYMLECADGTFYIGWTTDIAKRIESHNTSKVGAKYTKPRRPVKLVYSEELASKSAAMKREYELKQLSRQKKEQLLNKT